MYCGSRHVLRRLSSRSISRRHHHHGTRAALPADDDFQWFPRFFNLVEQHAFLSAALRKLDAAEPRASRKRRRDFLASRHRPTLDQQRTHCAGVLEDSFLPGDLYHFEEVRHRLSFFFLLRPWRLQPTWRGSPLLTAESRAIMTVSFDASGKCACQPGMTRKTRF